MSRVSDTQARIRDASRVEWRRLIRKASNKEAGPVCRNPDGKRLCGQSAALLVSYVERPHRAPRAWHPTPQRLLRGHAEN